MVVVLRHHGTYKKVMVDSVTGAAGTIGDTAAGSTSQGRRNGVGTMSYVECWTPCRWSRKCRISNTCCGAVWLIP